MKIGAVIAEYNPFHNGHQYQLETFRRQSDLDYIIVCMSGNFTQRGEPAIFDKWTRTKAALHGGADLVLELPTAFATRSAGYFARGAVLTLAATGIVSHLSCGVENTPQQDMANTLQQIAALLADEPEPYREALQHSIGEGMAYPQARQKALQELHISGAELLDTPNNILALEYCIALQERNSSMSILPIKREGGGYHDTGLDKSVFASATAIRELLEKTIGNENTCNNRLLSTELKDHLPEAVYSILAEKENKYITQNDFSSLLHYKLLTEGNSSLAKYADVTEDLSDKIHKNLRHYSDYTGFCELLKSKELTL